MGLKNEFISVQKKKNQTHATQEISEIITGNAFLLRFSWVTHSETDRKLPSIALLPNAHAARAEPGCSQQQEAPSCLTG